MKKNSMYDIIDGLIASKRFIGGLGRLKKDGSIVKINGQVFQRRTTKSGEDVILIDNFLGKSRKGSKKKWQLVLVSNLVALNSDKWRRTKVA